MMTRLALFSLALAGVLLSSHSAVAAPTKACDYMTVQTASQAFGAPLQAGREESLPMSAQQCVFQRANASLTFGVTDVSAMAAAFQTSTAAVIKIIEQKDPAVKTETIPSLGEWNSYVFNGLTTYTLKVLYHGKVLDLDCDGSKNPDLKAALVQAMRQTMQKF